jgi:GT2 family glycosyltransferase/glycosyltransferase involved in cell wall biosynthesis
MNQPDKIDIIVPLYVHNEEVLGLARTCIDSVVARTNYAFRLLLVDDCSPYDGLKKYLSGLAQMYPDIDIVILENEKNLGFVGTVNKGMRYGTNDVVLLNSDTEVSTGWLKRMVQCAYSNSRIATVSPFSNAATILSIPHFVKEGPLPEGYSVDDVARIVLKYSPGAYPELPTAHGFCMYIKRSVLDMVGLFDETLFGRGYGEENDFSNKCIELGYYNVLDDRTFVYHKGEASFQGSKKEIIEKNLGIINELYPYYFKQVDQFIKTNPLSQHLQLFKMKLGQNEKLDVDLTRDVKTILILTHNFGGGTDRYVNDLIKKLNLRYKVLLLKANVNTNLISLLLADGVTEIKFKLGNGTDFQGLVKNKEYNELLELIVTKYKVDLININSFILQSFEIIDVARKFNIPTSYILHDFNLICPTNHLIDDTLKYCGACNYGDEKVKCLDHNIFYSRKMTAQNLYNYRSYIKLHVLPNIDCFISPSASAASIIQAYYPEIKKIDVIPHAIADSYADQPTTPAIREGKHKLRVAVIGSIGVHKGLNVLKQLVRIIDHHKVELLLWGTSEPINHVTYKGSYTSDQVVNILQQNNLDLVLFPAIWPETFSYTLSESFAANIPAVVSNLGALKDRVEEYNTGWVIDMNNTKGLAELLESLYDNMEIIVSKKANISKIPAYSMGEMTDQYVHLYDDLIREKRAIHPSRSIALNYVSKSEMRAARFIGFNFRRQLQLVWKGFRAVFAMGPLVTAREVTLKVKAFAKRLLNRKPKDIMERNYL